MPGGGSNFRVLCVCVDVGSKSLNRCSLCKASELKVVEASKARPAEVDANALNKWLRSVRVRMALGATPSYSAGCSASADVICN